MGNFDIKKCLGKGGKGAVIYLLSFVVVSFVAKYPDFAQMDINGVVSMLLDGKAIGTITVGSLAMMAVNWLKNR